MVVLHCSQMLAHNMSTLVPTAHVTAAVQGSRKKKARPAQAVQLMSPWEQLPRLLALLQRLLPSSCLRGHAGPMGQAAHACSATGARQPMHAALQGPRACKIPIQILIQVLGACVLVLEEIGVQIIVQVLHVAAAWQWQPVQQWQSMLRACQTMAPKWPRVDCFDHRDHPMLTTPTDADKLLRPPRPPRRPPRPPRLPPRPTSI